MRKEIILIGKGGQGIILAGRALSQTLAKFTEYNVINMVFYGAETRGTDSLSEIIVADNVEESDYFRVHKADIAVFMHPEPLPKFSNKIKDNALVIIDSSFMKIKPNNSWKVYLKPFTNIAEYEVGNRRTANMVMLGFLLAITNIAKLEQLKETVKELLKPSWININLRALEIGYEYGKSDL